ncbi:MAG: hypothetical protein DME23_14775 [Verrucomicrobia bacterium]|nr:MAG: hypothetical protein DME23_14775 [Verrucomicrobiota bacterium]
MPSSKLGDEKRAEGKACSPSQRWSGSHHRPTVTFDFKFEVRDFRFASASEETAWLFRRRLALRTDGDGHEWNSNFVRVRRAAVGQVWREVARVGGLFRAEKKFQAGKKPPRFGFASRAVTDINVRPKQRPDLARLSGLPFVMQAGDRSIWFQVYAEARFPFHAIRVARGLNKLGTLSRRLRESRLVGTDFPGALAGSCVGDNAEQRTPPGHLSPAAALPGEDFRVSEAIQLAKKLQFHSPVLNHDIAMWFCGSGERGGCFTRSLRGA